MATNSFQQQVLGAAEDLARSVTFPFLAFLWSWFRRIVPLFLALLVIVSVALSAYTFFRQMRDHQLKFYAATGNSNGEDQVQRMKTRFRDDQSFLGPNYLVTPVPTGGSLENLRAVKRDEEGNVIGMTVEGLAIDKDDKKDINTLVPLQWCYLHLVARVDSLTRIGIEPAAYWDGQKSRPIQLTDLAAKYNWWPTHPDEWDKQQDKAKSPQKQRLRIYLGLSDSGARQLAELVLTNAGIKPAEVEPSVYIPSVDNVLEQLTQNNIDAAFILEPPPSEVINSIATEKPQQYTLISIDNISDLLPNHKCLVSAKIPQGTYPFLVPSNEDSTTHLAEIACLATRRLIVASSKMSNSDAYYLANSVRAALPRDQVSLPDKDGHWRGPDLSANESDHPLSYDLHQGVDFYPDAAPAFNWFGRNLTWVGPLLLAMLVSLVTELKNRIPTWLDRHRMDLDSPSAYNALETQLEAFYQELLEAYDGSDQLSDVAVKSFNERLGELTSQIRPLRRAGKLSRNEVEALHQIAFKTTQLLDSVRREPPMRPLKSITRLKAKDEPGVGTVEVTSD